MSSKVKKVKKSSTSKQPVSVKTPSSNAKGTKPLGNPKGTVKARRRLSYPATEKKTVEEEKQWVYSSWYKQQNHAYFIKDISFTISSEIGF